MAANSNVALNGMSGRVIMNENGSRDPEYALAGLDVSGAIVNFATISVSGLNAVRKR